jgi:uncharacterized membrane protein YkoI
MTHSRLKLLSCTLALALAGTSASMAVPAAANAPAFSLLAAQSQQREDQGEARKEMKAGNQLSLREIERRILPQMKGAEYLGPAYDAVAHAYRLKFIKDGRVMYVDVDARTGKIINRSR